MFISLGSLSRVQYLSRLAAFHEPSVHPTWRPSTNSVFVPLGSLSRAQYLSRLAAFREPSVYPAWRPFTSPGFIPLGGCHEPSVYPAWRPFASPVFIPLGGKSSVCLAWRQPRVYLAWRLFHSSRSRQHRPGGLKPTLHKPCVYLAWRRDQPLSRLAESPAFTSLGGLSRTQYVSRLAAFREPSVYPAWRSFANPVFVPLDGAHHSASNRSTI